MNILSTLVRLEHALGCPELTKQMVLLPARADVVQPPRGESRDVNLVVGYNGSPRSQTALDLTLWIAHQTRLATGKQVTVQVVYVVDMGVACGQVKPFKRGITARSTWSGLPEARSLEDPSQTWRPIARAANQAVAALPDPQSCKLDQFEQADHILWQARTLADEWRGSLKTHLRFGEVATELRQVVEAESASLLLLGCESVTNPIVKQLENALRCPVLGIPPAV